MDAGMRVTRGGEEVAGIQTRCAELQPRYANQPPTSPRVPPPTTQQPHLATTLVITRVTRLIL